MPTLDVLDVNKQKVGSVELRDAVFGIQPDGVLVHTAVVMQQANRRQGTASTKTRGEVSGGGKKPWKQKHTGRARAGSTRSPLWRHGGTVFGPKPRSYAFSIPKKMYRTAMKSALSAKVAEGAVVVVSELRLEQPKTKLLATLLKQLGLHQKTLIVTGADDPYLERAARNMPTVRLLGPEQLNVYDLLQADSILIPQDQLERVQEAWT